MLRKLTLLVSLVMAMGLTAVTASAQDVPASPDDVDGLESAYARMYMPDFEAMLESVGTPGAMDDFDENAVMFVMTVGFTFDSADNAEQALDMFGEGFTSEISGSEDLEASDIDDLGDQAVMYSGTIADAGEPMTTVSLVIQDGENVYMIQVAGGELEPGEQQAEDIARFMMDREIETEEVTLNQDGTSTGGVFDLMPTAEDSDLVGDLAPNMDMDMLSDTGF